jgi:transcription antitermination factor NusG
MESNWYVICTKKKKERKVAAALNKEGIENFCPFTILEIKNVSRSSKEYGPLFSSYIFVKMQPADLNKIKRMPYVVNPLYWKSEPAIINNDEINAIKMMCENYSTIRLEKITVSTSERVGVVEKNITGYNNHTVLVQHQGISVNLPSLGYTLSSEREKEKTAAEKVREVEYTARANRFNPLVFFGINL